MLGALSPESIDPVGAGLLEAAGYEVESLREGGWTKPTRSPPSTAWTYWASGPQPRWPPRSCAAARSCRSSSPSASAPPDRPRGGGRRGSGGSTRPTRTRADNRAYATSELMLAGSRVGQRGRGRSRPRGPRLDARRTAAVGGSTSFVTNHRGCELRPWSGCLALRRPDLVRRVRSALRTPAPRFRPALTAMYDRANVRHNQPCTNLSRWTGVRLSRAVERTSSGEVDERWPHTGVAWSAACPPFRPLQKV